MSLIGVAERAIGDYSNVSPGNAAQALVRTRHYAKAALWIVLGMFVVAQPLSVPLAYQSLRVLYAGEDTHSQWQDYLSRDAPDVLFLGASDTKSDVDTRAVAAELSSVAAGPVSVGKLGVDAEKPDFFAALMYRVMHRPTHPRLVIISLAENEFSIDYPFDPTSDLWQISEPFDLGFMQAAYRLDPDRDQLARRWLVPYFATFRPIVSVAQCPLLATARRSGAIARTFHAVRDLNDCEVGRSNVTDRVMDPERNRKVMAGFVAAVSNFHFDERQGENLKQAIEIARQGAAQVVLMRNPNFRLGGFFTDKQQLLLDRLRGLAMAEGVPFIDLVDVLQDDSFLWNDFQHLNRTGARAYAPILAKAISRTAGAFKTF
jgi:hypothetical protein